MNNSLSYQDIVRDCARRKLIDLAKSFLDIIDELRKEDSNKVNNFIAMADENGFGENARKIRPFLYLLDENKKEIVRKRVLDEMNKLARELDS